MTSKLSSASLSNGDRKPGADPTASPIKEEEDPIDNWAAMGLVKSGANPQISNPIDYRVGTELNRTLLSDRRFVTRMISLRVFLHFRVGYRNTNQDLSSGKSSIERILKKSQKFMILSFIFHKEFYTFFNSLLLILIKFPSKCALGMIFH